MIKGVYTVRIGICTNIDRMMDAKDAGADYVEFNVSLLANMDEKSYEDAKKKTKEADIFPETCNGFLPRNIKVVGANVDVQAVRRYMEIAIKRVAGLGCKIIVFGSGGSRKCPEDWPTDKAYHQFINIADMAGSIGAKHGITIALENLNRSETNILNYVKEAWQAAKDTGNPNVKVLIDFYHMRVENEDLAILKKLKEYIAHVHIARKVGRYYPLTKVEDLYEEFFANLKAAGYDDRISIEAGCNDFSTDAPKSVKLLKSLWESTNPA